MPSGPQLNGNAASVLEKGRRVLPADLILDAARRVGLASLAMGIVMLVLIAERAVTNPPTHALYVLEGVTTVISFGLYLACRAGRIPTTRIMNVALMYEMVLCFVLSYMEFSVPGGAMKVLEGGISWSCLVIVMFPALVPSTPRRALAAGFCGASMGPLAYALALLLHDDTPLSLTNSASLFMDNYLAGALTIVPSLVFTKLAGDVASAREMGSYTLEQKLGSGGMGEVWKARHRLLARPAAVKLIRPEAMGSTDLNVLQRFEREARATSALRSPNTVVLYDFGLSDDGTFYYVMELLDGLDVESLVERFGALPANRVAYLMRQACMSLEEAHRAALVHRDIKPANIYVCHLGTEYDFVKLLDFGLVKTLGPDDAKLSSTNMIYGTPAYMPPEQARGEEVTPRTDIYALGCVAYYMLTGRMVFEGKNTAQVMLDHQQTVVQTPSRRISRFVPPEFEAIVMQCLEKEPAHRPQSAMEIVRRIETCDVGRAWTACDAENWWTEYLPELTPQPAHV